MTLIKKVFTLSLRIFLVATLVAQSFAPLVNNIAYAAGSSDLSISIPIGPNSANNGDIFTYVVYMRNDGPAAANGASFLSQLPVGSTNISVACTLTGNGSVCPSLSTGTSFVSGVVSVFPNNGIVEITITGRFAMISPTSVSHIATISVPSGNSDAMSGNNLSQINTTITTLPADVEAVVSGSIAPWVYGTPVTYEITHTNYGSGYADGGRIYADLPLVYNGTHSFDMAVTGYSINCMASGGAVCPSLPSTRTSLGAFYNGTTVATWPSGGSLKITVSFIPTGPINTEVCVAGGGTYTPNISQVRATSYEPTGITDPVPSNNTDQLSITIPNVVIPACPEVDVEAVVSGSAAPWVYGTPVTYEITHTNYGPDSADGGRIYADVSALIGVTSYGVNITGYSINCMASGGAVCPSLPSTRTSLGAFYNGTTVATWPSGGSLKITISFTPLTPPVCSFVNTSFNVYIRGISYEPSGTIDPVSSNDSDTLLISYPINCVDLTALIDVFPLYSYINTPMQIAMIYRNGGPGNATGPIIISGTLSNGFIYDNRSCSSSGGAMCGTVSYDIMTQSFTGSIGSMPNGGQITYYFSGRSTSYSSTWRTYSNIYHSTGDQDSHLSTNFSQLNFSVIEDNPIILKNSIDKTVTPGGQVRYMLDVINPISGLNLATGMLTDTLPTGFTYNSTLFIGLSGTATRIPLIDPVIGTSSPTRGEFYLYAGDSIHVEFLVDVASLLPNGTGIYQNSSFFTYSTEFSGYNSIHYDGDLTGVINDDVFVDIPSPAIIDANNDSVLFTGGTTGIVNILTNDTLSGGQATIGNIVVLFSGSTIFTGLVYDNTGGQIVVGPMALTGIYTIPYQICEIVNPSNCDTATVIITIIEPPIIPIIATDDNALFTGGIGGIINILTNDTLSGNQATTGNVTVLFTGVGPSFSFTGAQYFTGLVYDTTGGQVVVGPTALTGIYTIPYYICELNYDSHGIQLTNLKNCDPATIIITIVSPLIVVPPIVPPIVIPPSGGGGGGYAGCGTGCYISPQPEIIHPAPPIKKQVKLTPVIEDIPLIPKTGPAKIIDGLQEIGKNVYNTLFIAPTSVNHIPKNMDQWIQDRLGDHTQKSIGYFIVPKYSIIIPLLKQEVDGGYVITKESYYMIQMMLMAISEDDTVWLYNWEDSDKTFVLKEYNYDSEVKEKLSLSYKNYTTTLGIRK